MSYIVWVSIATGPESSLDSDCMEYNQRQSRGDDSIHSRLLLKNFIDKIPTFNGMIASNAAISILSLIKTLNSNTISFEDDTYVFDDYQSLLVFFGNMRELFLSHPNATVVVGVQQ